MNNPCFPIRKFILLYFFLLILGCNSDPLPQSTKSTEPAETSPAGSLAKKEPTNTPLKKRKAKPVLPSKTKPAVKNNKSTKSHLGTIMNKTGDVWFTPTLKSPPHPAPNKALLFGENVLWTDKDAKVDVLLKNVGLLSVDENSKLIFPNYTPCGTVLLQGAVKLLGHPKKMADAKCFLHTPSGALQAGHPGAKIDIQVDSTGKITLKVLSGIFALVDLVGKPTLLNENQQTTIAPAYLENTDAILDEAEQITNRLGLDVEMLATLMTDNKALMAQRQEHKSNNKPEDYAQTSNELSKQAAQMVALQKLGLLQVNRIFALTQLVKQNANKSIEDADRANNILKRLDTMKTKLPQLFN